MSMIELHPLVARVVALDMAVLVVCAGLLGILLACIHGAWIVGHQLRKRDDRIRNRFHMAQMRLVHSNDGQV